MAQTSFSAAGERLHVHVKLRPGQIFLRSIYFPWLFPSANHFRTWLRGREVNAAPGSNWLNGSERDAYRLSALGCMCQIRLTPCYGLSLLRYHGDEGSAEPKHRLESVTEVQGKGKFSFQAHLSYILMESDKY